MEAFALGSGMEARKSVYGHNLARQSVVAFKRNSNLNYEQEDSLLSLNKKKRTIQEKMESSKEDIRVSNEYRIKLIV